MAWMQNQLYVKKKNTLMVLNLIAQDQTISRTQLSDITELSPASITRIVGTLIGLNLVREEGTVDIMRRGRKARILRLSSDGLYAAGICIERDRLLLCLTDFHQKCLFRTEMPLVTSEPHTPEILAEHAKKLYNSMDRSIIPDWSRVRIAGISIPGVVDSENGIVLKSDQMNWTDVDLRSPFERALKLPVWIENDAKACLMGERVRMNIPKNQDTVYVLVGTGVGVAVLSNGKLIRGHRNMAGEIEHLNLMPGILPADVLQAHLIEDGILKNARTASPSVQTLEDLMIAYRQNTGFARILVDDVMQYLRLVLSMIDSFYDPERIILGGTTVRKLQEALSALFQDQRLSIGENYEEACMLGVSIEAVQCALDKLLSE
jgi:predicted NBD/HSP70 family sugar kinase